MYNARKIAVENKLDVGEFFEYLNQNKGVYDVWEHNGELEIGKFPRKVVDDFDAYSTNNLESKVRNICEQVGLPTKGVCVYHMWMVEISNLQDLDEDEWEHSEIISMMKSIDFYRKPNGNRCEFFKQ